MNIINYAASVNMTFDEAAFNSVDAVVLCSLFYGRIEDVIDVEPKNKTGVPIRDFYKQEYFAAMFSDGIHDTPNKELLTILAASPRFRDIKVRNIEFKLDDETEMQFAAATFALDSSTDFVCFRGTDGTMTGWKEDFNLSFMDELPSQRAAAKYLSSHFSSRYPFKVPKKIYVGGHSKGGNLAIYGSSMCSKNVRSMIKKVYSFDGPGFREEVLEKLRASWEETPLDIVKIVPRSSFIGAIMNDDQDVLVVNSDSHLFGQHISYTWVVDGMDFDYADDLSGTSTFFDETVTEWLKSASDTQRQTFVDAVFQVIQDVNVETVKDLKALSLSDIKDVIASIKSIPQEDHDVISKLLFSLAMSAAKANIKGVKDAITG